MRLFRRSSDSASRAAHVAGPPMTAGTPLTAALTGVRIVLVEDHDDTRNMLAQVFRQLGATVSSATAAREALGMLAEADIVLTDFALPGEDGVWLLDQVHKVARPIPVIALSGFAESEEPRLSEAPFIRKLLKPVDPWALADTIREVVRARW
jgi:CheY-like chemotaxis protein